MLNSCMAESDRDVVRLSLKDEDLADLLIDEDSCSSAPLRRKESLALSARRSQGQSDQGLPVSTMTSVSEVLPCTIM